MNAVRKVEVNETADQNLGYLVKQYKHTARMIKNYQTELELYKAALSSAAIESEEMTFVVDDCTVKLIECERETFGLKEAKLILGDALIPFMKKSSYTQLRVG